MLRPALRVSWLTLFLSAAALAAACGDDTSSSGGAGGGQAGAPSGGGGSTGNMGGMGGVTSTGGGGTNPGGMGGTGGDGGAGGCANSLELLEDLPGLLSDTGLYADIATDTVADNIRPFEPKFPLWTDAAEKRRWIYLPECAQIDTTDMDAWEFPVGTRVYKEFTRDGVRVETRVILRTGPAATDFKFGAYIWNSAIGDAELNILGEDDANGTQHDVPPQTACAQCHRGPWRVLGFSAFQLSHDQPGETMASLSAEGKLTVPAPSGFQVPGDEVAQQALGTLHANCGSCHYVGGVLPTLDMELRLRTSATTVEETGAYLSAVNQQPNMYSCGGCDLIEPGDASASAVVMRMGIRGAGQMPPLGTELVDSVGLSAVEAWIDALPIQ